MLSGIPLLLIAVLFANTNAFVSNRMTTITKRSGESFTVRESSRLQLQVSKYSTAFLSPTDLLVLKEPSYESLIINTASN